MLQVDELTVRFVLGKRSRRRVVHAVESVGFALDANETLAIVGESGSGKSTTARAILGLVKPDSGSVRFLGQQLLDLKGRSLRAARRDMQAVFQDPYSSLNPMMTVEDIIAEPLDNYESLSRQARQARVRELLDVVRLPSTAAGRYPHEFSGGQRQRVAIARALALEPRLIICDEAVSALDVSIRNQVLTLLQDLQRQFGISFLFIGHDLSVIRQFADRVAVMYLGHIVETGTTAEVFSAPRHQYTHALLSATPSHHGGAHRNRIVLAGEIPDPAAPPTGCVFRTRCPAATDICAEEAPPRVVTSTGEAFCHHPLEPAVTVSLAR